MKRDRTKIQSISDFEIEEVNPVKHFILLNVLQAVKKPLPMFYNAVEIFFQSR